MKISFRDVNLSVVEGVRHYVEALGVEVTHGSILDLECDAVVSPGNSFGFMDGNLEYVYSKHFGWHVQTQVQQAILQLPFGELLVGQALSVPTGNPKIPHIISAPTMRVPMRIADPVDVLLAARAAIYEAKRMNFQHIGIPGMGTGCGDISGDTCGRALNTAIRMNFQHLDVAGTQRPVTWMEAQYRHFNLVG